jgi:hypothetical protein
MPVALAGLDVHHVADGDLALLGFAGDNPPASRDNEYLKDYVGFDAPSEDYRFGAIPSSIALICRAT